MRELPFFRILAVAAFTILAFAYVNQKDAVERERVIRFNAEAQRDSSRVLLRDSAHTLTERLAFQSDQTIELSRDLDRLIRQDGSRVQMIARLRLVMDSIHGAVTTGQVSGDSAIRILESRLDTLGFHVGFRATVPAPPETASVEWNVAHEPESVLVALNRTEEGRLALRALTGPNSTAVVDTAIARVETNLRHTRSLATKGLWVLVGVALARLLF